MEKPLAIRLRPQTLDEVFGQEHLTQKGALLERFINSGKLLSLIFFGPPGSGKTTVARILSQSLNLPYASFNAVTGNKKDLTQHFQEARAHGQLVLIVDEVHRLNKDKQDLLLPYVEEGSVLLIGLTSLNPYFTINPAIRSRCMLCQFKPLTTEALEKCIDFALSSPQANLSIELNQEARDSLIEAVNGDTRMLYNTLEALDIAYPNQTVTPELLHQLNIKANSAFDSGDDGYYDSLSAFQKSIRGSDVDAALYYLGRLIQAEDLDSIERRLLITAYEDIGLANPAVVGRTLAAVDTARRVGFPEAKYPLSVAVVDLALSPKSKSAIHALSRAMTEAEHNPLPIPSYLRLTPVNLNPQDKYDYTRPELWHRIAYLPEGTKNLPFYRPEKNSPYENTLASNLEKLKAIQRTYSIRTLNSKKK